MRLEDIIRCIGVALIAAAILLMLFLPLLGIVVESFSGFGGSL